MSSLDEQVRWVCETAAVCLLSDHIVRVIGDDAPSWLNGQVTNDVRTLRTAAATYALATTVKGRVISDLWARGSTTGPVLTIPAITRDALLESFNKHIIMEDVELKEDPELCILSVQGPRAIEVASGLGGAHGQYECSRLLAAGVDIVVHRSESDGVLAELTQRARAIGGGLLTAEGLAHAHVLLAVPRIGADFGDTTYPQEAGLKERAVSFSKGCYAGQEVVYMLENRGQLSRKLVQLSGPVALSLSRGTALYDAQGARVGEVTSVAGTERPEPVTLTLAYLKRAHAEVGGHVFAGSSEGACFTVRSVVGLTNHACPIVAR